MKAFNEQLTSYIYLLATFENSHKIAIVRRMLQFERIFKLHKSNKSLIALMSI